MLCLVIETKWQSILKGKKKKSEDTEQASESDTINDRDVGNKTGNLKQLWIKMLRALDWMK